MHTVDKAPGSVRGCSSLLGACLDPASEQPPDVSERSEVLSPSRDSATPREELPIAKRHV